MTARGTRNAVRMPLSAAGGAPWQPARVGL